MNISNLQVLKSAAGWYIGRLDSNSFPFSRESTEYFPTEQLAQLALKTNTFTQRSHP